MRRSIWMYGATAVLLSLTACGGDDSTTEPAAPAVSGGDPADADQASSTGGGGCSVDVSGDYTTSWTAPATAASVLVSEWMSDEERDVIDNEFMIILNCDASDGDGISITSSSSADTSTIPIGPATYQFSPASAGMTDDLFDATVLLSETDAVWGIAEAGGTLEITEFDGDHIAGTFSLPMVDVLAAMSGEASKGTILVTGQFDFPKP